MAVLQLAEFLLLVFADSVLTCLRLFLCREFHNVVHNHLAVHRFAHLYLVFLIVVLIKTCDNHYYDENEIEVGKPIQCQVAVNHIVELTAEEKAEARQQAVRRYQDEELRKLQNRTKPTKAKTETQVQPSLFDFGL